MVLMMDGAMSSLPLLKDQPPPQQDHNVLQVVANLQNSGFNTQPLFTNLTLDKQLPSLAQQNLRLNQLQPLNRAIVELNAIRRRMPFAKPSKWSPYGAIITSQQTPLIMKQRVTTPAIAVKSPSMSVHTRRSSDESNTSLQTTVGSTYLDSSTKSASVSFSIDESTASIQLTVTPTEPTLQELIKHKIDTKASRILSLQHKLLIHSNKNGQNNRRSIPKGKELDDVALLTMLAESSASNPAGQWKLFVQASLKHYQNTTLPKSSQKLASRRQRNTMVTNIHAAAYKAWRQEREKAQRQRLAALKSDNLEEYLELVKGAKNSQIDKLLAQTDACLRALTDRLKLAVNATATRKEPAATSSSSPAAIDNSNSNKESMTALQKSSEAWNSLASAFDVEEITEQPTILSGGQLRDYQLQGLRWMVSLHKNGVNGILADEMGLGKTVQVIALVAYLMEQQQQKQETPKGGGGQKQQQQRPFLIAAPSSVLPNWEKEFERWAPEINVVSYKGNAERREQIWNTQLMARNRNTSSFNVVLTTYDFLMGKVDRPRLARIKWSHVIIDEGHRLKNSECRLHNELKFYTTSNRLLLTGTPLQNSLNELWGLLNFLMPTLFDSSDDFESWFGAAVGKETGISGSNSGDGSSSNNDDDAKELAMLSEEETLIVTSRLHQVLRPFMLRRLKEAVAGELPEKTEHLIPCYPAPYQQQLFNLLEEQLAQPGGARGINNTLMELRCICNHPLLSKLHVEGAENRLPRHPLPAEVRLCGKLEVLDRILMKLKAGSHKVLLFCTMTKLLDVMEGYLEWRGLTYLRLDGSTPASERGSLVDQFNSPQSDAFVFLLSVRAGGVGLNLQAADTVIFYDTDWNPQIMEQAKARAHRIGQTKNVLVLRLQTVGTVEERVVQVAMDKKHMAERSITGGFFDGKTSASERQKYLLELLRKSGGGNNVSDTDHSSNSSSYTDERMNTVLARSEKELKLFRSLDGKRYKAEDTAWKKLALGDGSIAASYTRLATFEDTMPLAIEAEEAARGPPDQDLGRDFGRGKRARQQDVNYSDARRWTKKKESSSKMIGEKIKEEVKEEEEEEKKGEEEQLRAEVDILNTVAAESS